MRWVVNATPRHAPPLYSGKDPVPIVGWVGRRAGLEGCGKSRPHQRNAQDETNYTPTAPRSRVVCLLLGNCSDMNLSVLLYSLCLDFEVLWWIKSTVMSG
jgi:hypothetical protein